MKLFSFQKPACWLFAVCGWSLLLTIGSAASGDLSPSFSSAGEVPFTAEEFTATGKAFGSLTLSYAPSAGTVLTAIQNTGTGPIDGTFSDLADTATVSAVFNGKTYQFIANYQGGTGNDLTLILIGPGVIDPSFRASFDGRIWAMAMQPDRKIIVGGPFLNVNGIPRQSLARLFPDGKLDTGFQGSTNYSTEMIVVQDDGKILIGGPFIEVNGVGRREIARLNPDGSLDAGFDVRVGGVVRKILPLRNGKILVGGSFTTVNGLPRRSLARINADGSLDTTFTCDVAGIVGSAYELADGSVFLGGDFNYVRGIPMRGVVKIGSSGFIDPTFSAPTINGYVYTICIQPDGKILMGGGSLTIGSSSTSYALIRLNPAGFFEYGFSSAPGDQILSMVMQADGKVLAGGSFRNSTGNVIRAVTRFTTTGAVDTTYAAAADSFGSSVVMASDGSIFVGGDFKRVNGIAVERIAKLVNGPVTQTLEVVGNNTISWQRTGPVPDFSNVDVQVSASDGSNWTTLGAGNRVTGGWEFVTTNPLPASGYLRVLGRERSSGWTSAIIEQTSLFGRQLSSIEQWRQQHFGEPTNERNGGDRQDPDQDGVANLLEYAFGSSPRVAGDAVLPVWSKDQKKFAIDFTPPLDVSGITYQAQWSDTLGEGDWHDLPNLGMDPQLRFTAPFDGQPKRFVRLKVANP